MTLKDNLICSGNILFKYRSFIPLLLIPFMIFYIKIKNQLFLDYNLYILILCIILSSIGLFIRILTIGYVPNQTSGRNTKEQIANVLNTSGTYSLLRHPLYLGNYLIISGPVLYSCDISFYLIYFIDEK